MKQLIFNFLIVIGLTSCLSKEVDINLPDYKSQLVVECYLEPGYPYTLLLTKSNSYFDPFSASDPLSYFESLLERDAKVFILRGNDTIALEEKIQLNEVTGRLSNYSNDDIVPVDFESEYRLLIQTKDGKTITAQTRIPKVVVLDSVRFEFADNDRKVTSFLYHYDDPTEANYYRRRLSFAPADTIGDQDYVTDDKLFDTELVAFGGFYEKPDKSTVKGDTMFYTLMSITEDYFTFYNSVSVASSANQNPFSQPGQIKSNVHGPNEPIGIFTGLSRYRGFRIIQ